MRLLSWVGLMFLALQAARGATVFSLQGEALGNGGADAGGRFAVVSSFAGTDIAGPTPGGGLGIASGFAAVAFTPPVPGREEAIEPALAISSSLTRNPQTGLVELRVRLQNTWVTAIGGVRLFVEGLPTGVRVQNAAQSGATIFVQHGVELAVGQSTELVLEFYSADRRTTFAPTLRAVAYVGGSEVAPTGTSFTVRQALRLTGGSYFIEFNATPGEQYQIQYSTNLLAPTAWRTAPGVITAVGASVVWVDSGPPKTDLDLTSSAPRFYRVVRLQTTGVTP